MFSNWSTSRLGTADLSSCSHIKVLTPDLHCAWQILPAGIQTSHDKALQLSVIVTNFTLKSFFKKQLCISPAMCCVCFFFFRSDTVDRQIIQTLKGMWSVIWTACTHRHLSLAHLSPHLLPFMCQILLKNISFFKKKKWHVVQPEKATAVNTHFCISPVYLSFAVCQIHLR